MPGARNTFLTLLLTIAAMLSLAPLLWMVLTSFLPKEALDTFPPVWSGRLTARHYRDLVLEADMLRWLVNSGIVCASVAFGQMATASLAGYAFARGAFRGRHLFFAASVGTMMVPGQILLVPLYALMLEFGLLDSLWAVVLPALASPFGIYLVRQYLLSLSSALEDAARLDGCSVWGVYWHVALPLAAPAVAVVGLFAFISEWNAFLWPLMVLHSSPHFTATVGLATLQDQHVLDYGLVMAGATMAAVPVILIYLLLQRTFAEGTRAGAVKG